MKYTLNSANKFAMTISALAKNRHGLIGRTGLLLFRVDIVGFASGTLENALGRDFAFFKNFLGKIKIGFQLDFPLSLRFIGRTQGGMRQVYVGLSRFMNVLVTRIGCKETFESIVPLGNRSRFKSTPILMQSVFKNSCFLKTLAACQEVFQN